MWLGDHATEADRVRGVHLGLGRRVARVPLVGVMIPLRILMIVIGGAGVGASSVCRGFVRESSILILVLGTCYKLRILCGEVNSTITIICTCPVSPFYSSYLACPSVQIDIQLQHPLPQRAWVEGYFDFICWTFLWYNSSIGVQYGT